MTRTGGGVNTRDSDGQRGTADGEETDEMDAARLCEIHEGDVSTSEADDLVACVSCVLTPSGLSVWAPKEEVKGMLALLHG